MGHKAIVTLHLFDKSKVAARASFIGRDDEFDDDLLEIYTVSHFIIRTLSSLGKCEQSNQLARRFNAILHNADTPSRWCPEIEVTELVGQPAKRQVRIEAALEEEKCSHKMSYSGFGLLYRHYWSYAPTACLALLRYSALRRGDEHTHSARIAIAASQCATHYYKDAIRLWNHTQLGLSIAFATVAAYPSVDRLENNEQSDNVDAGPGNESQAVAASNRESDVTIIEHEPESPVTTANVISSSVAHPELRNVVDDETTSDNPILAALSTKRPKSQLVWIAVTISVSCIIGISAYALGWRRGQHLKNAPSKHPEGAVVAEPDTRFETKHLDDQFVRQVDLVDLPKVQDATRLPSLDSGRIRIPLPLGRWFHVSTAEARIFDAFARSDSWSADGVYLAAASFQKEGQREVKAEIYVTAHPSPPGTWVKDGHDIDALAFWLAGRWAAQLMAGGTVILEKVSPVRIGKYVGVEGAIRQADWDRYFFMMVYDDRLYRFEIRTKGIDLDMARPQLWALVNGISLN